MRVEYPGRSAACVRLGRGSPRFLGSLVGGMIAFYSSVFPLKLQWLLLAAQRWNVIGSLHHQTYLRDDGEVLALKLSIAMSMSPIYNS